MSGTPIEMSKVKQVIRMYESGVPKRDIARRLCILKNTVKDYIKKAEEKNLSPPELLEKTTPELEGMFVASVYTNEKYLQLEGQFPYFEKTARHVRETFFKDKKETMDSLVEFGLATMMTMKLGKSKILRLLASIGQFRY